MSDRTAGWTLSWEWVRETMEREHGNGRSFQSLIPFLDMSTDYLITRALIRQKERRS